MWKKEVKGTVVWEWFVGLTGLACMVRLFVMPVNLAMAISAIGATVSAMAYLSLAGALEHLEWWQRGSANQQYCVWNHEEDYKSLRGLTVFLFLLFLVIFMVNVVPKDAVWVYQLVAKIFGQ